MLFSFGALGILYLGFPSPSIECLETIPMKEGKGRGGKRGGWFSAGDDF